MSFLSSASKRQRLAEAGPAAATPLSTAIATDSFQKLARAISSASSEPSSSLSVTPPLQLLSLLQSSLLAIVASHLALRRLLVLQRCSSALHRLRGDESYVAVAWRFARLILHTSDPFPTWAFSPPQSDIGPKLSIPVHLWLAARPALNAVLAGRERSKTHQKDEQWCRQLQQLRQLAHPQQPTRWRLAERDSQGVLWETDESDEKGSTDEECVEVLNDFNVEDVHRMALRERDVEVRCRLVLQACPLLQHLELHIDTVAHMEPSHEDTFALVPRLRSLSLYPSSNRHLARELVVTELPVDFKRMLDSLPCLTALHVTNIFVDVDDLLVIASHSTLEELSIEAVDNELADRDWIGAQIAFPTSAAEGELQLAQAFAEVKLDGDIEAECENEEAKTPHVHSAKRSVTETCSATQSGEEMPACMRDDEQRLLAALARTQPTRRSCETRLALTDWLHKRLKQGRLRTNEDRPAWLLRHYRRQVELLLRKLHRDLRELAEAETAPDSTRMAMEKAEQLQDRLEQCEFADALLDYQCQALADMERRQAESRRVLNDYERSIVTREMTTLSSAIAKQQRKVTDLYARLQLLTQEAHAFVR